MDRINITALAIKRQISAMHESLFEVGIRRSDGKMMQRRWDSNTLHQKEVVSWLRHENAKKSDVFIRPAGFEREAKKKRYPGIILVDDITYKSIKNMHREGYQPSVAIETSHQNFQCWIYLTGGLIDWEHHLSIARFLQKKFGGDFGAAQPGQFGRLAGFVNHKIEHRGANGGPFVRCLDATHKRADKADELLDGIPEKDIAVSNTTNRLLRRGAKNKSADLHNLFFGGRNDDLAALGFFSKNMFILKEKYGASFDPSRAEWMVVAQMLINQFSPTAIIYALVRSNIAGINNVLLRKKHHTANYINRTITKCSRELREKGCRVPRTEDSFFNLLEELEDQIVQMHSKQSGQNVHQ